MLTQDAVRLKKIVNEGRIESLDKIDLERFASMHSNLFMQEVPVAGLDGVVRMEVRVVLPARDEIIDTLRKAGKAPAKGR